MLKWCKATTNLYSTLYFCSVAMRCFSALLQTMYRYLSSSILRNWQEMDFGMFQLKSHYWISEDLRVLHEMRLRAAQSHPMRWRHTQLKGDIVEMVEYLKQMGRDPIGCSVAGHNLPMIESLPSWHFEMEVIEEHLVEWHWLKLSGIEGTDICRTYLHMITLDIIPNKWSRLDLLVVWSNCNTFFIIVWLTIQVFIIIWLACYVDVGLCGHVWSCVSKLG